jgi:predicted acyl esterase
MSEYKSEKRDGMAIDWDVPVAMDDGIILRGDVFRPPENGRYPVILGCGPYGKLLHFGDGYPDQYFRMLEQHPDVAAGSTNKYQSFELCDPEKFTPHGYTVVRFDSRGAGRSEGFLDPFSARETKDFYDLIEWCGQQPWSNGKVGLSGISYLATNQWQVAALRPPHLAAICAWEGMNDFYREWAHHGGMMSTFGRSWYAPFVLKLQNGLGENGYKSSMNGDWVSGPDTLSEDQLARNRIDWHEEALSHKLASDEFWTSRTPDLTKIEVPVLSNANWGGAGLHLRGNVEGYLEAASAQKYLEFHCLEHWTEYYTDYGVGLQRRFFDYFLKGEDTGWGKQPPVQMLVRHVDGNWQERHEQEWPLARTQWREWHLDAASSALVADVPAAAANTTYRGFSDGISFATAPLDEETEITGPLAARLFVSSSTEDADLFAVVRVFDPSFREVTFQGHTDPHTTIAQGWLRASHRKLDEAKSLPYRPYHAHDEIQKLSPGEIYQLDIEIWPTCVVVPAGYRLVLSVRGKDYEFPGGPSGLGVKMLGTFTGVGPFRHDEARDHPADIFDGEVTVHTGPDHPSRLLAPVIPPA